MPSPGNTAERPTPESCGLPVSDGISWLELMAADSRPAPDVLVTPSYQNRGSTPICRALYQRAFRPA
jgi:hypothetical protein